MDAGQVVAEAIARRKAVADASGRSLEQILEWNPIPYWLIYPESGPDSEAEPN